MRTQLLCTFTNKNDIDNTIKNIKAITEFVNAVNAEWDYADIYDPELDADAEARYLSAVENAWLIQQSLFESKCSYPLDIILLF